MLVVQVSQCVLCSGSRLPSSATLGSLCLDSRSCWTPNIVECLFYFGFFLCLLASFSFLSSSCYYHYYLHLTLSTSNRGSRLILHNLLPIPQILESVISARSLGSFLLKNDIRELSGVRIKNEPSTNKAKNCIHFDLRKYKYISL